MLVLYHKYDSMRGLDKMIQTGCKWKLILFVYLLLWFAGSLYGLLYWMGNKAPQGQWLGLSLPEIRSYLIYAWAGANGGTLYAVRMLHQFHSCQSTMQWFLWYFSRPLLCAGTAVFVILLLESGILPILVSPDEKARIGVAFLAGLGYGKIAEKLMSLTETLFNGKKQTAEEPSSK